MIKANNEKNKIDNRSENEIEHDRMMKEFFDRGGVVQKIPAGITGSEYYGTPAVVNKWAKKKKK
jgi:hypothetical protein|tara:strand:- start:6539 stop:6730 length:192 start_codon:yes stop_codon:yes gene_type:complete